MLRRKLYDDLMEWKNGGAKKALCITGARQIGKSTLARNFGTENYEKVIEVNFITQPEMKEAFLTPDPDRIYPTLLALKNEFIVPGSTLLILDEIQECPNARTAIKFLVQDHRADIIETGSLLGVNIQEVKSYPVGFEILLPMYPMTFEEFLWAQKVRAETILLLKNCYEKEEPVADVIHRQMLQMFYLYMVVGGMPEAVQVYVNTNSLTKVREIQLQILNLYRSDIQKYADRKERPRILEVFNSIPGQLNAKNKRFKVAKIDRRARTYQFEGSFLWLEAAGIGLPCYNVSAPEYPLLMNEERSLFKLYLCDTGLLCAEAGEKIAQQIFQGDVEINMGGILENMFAQAIRSRDLNLFYFDSKKNYELDFLVQNQDHVDVLEIKSGKYYRKHASLDKSLAMPDWKLENAYVFCKGNVEREGTILYLPLYMIMFYDQQRFGEIIWKPDFSALTGNYE